MALPATDNFNRADGGLGTNWTTITSMGAPQINTNGVVTTATGSDSAARWNADTFGNDQYAQVVCSALAVNNAKFIGGIVRAQSAAQSFYAAGFEGPAGATAVGQVRKLVGGVTQIITSATVTFNVADVARCEVSGTTITLLKNGATTGVSGTAGDFASGSAGVFVYVDDSGITNAKLDDWEGGNLGAATSGRGAWPGLAMVGVM